MCHMSKGALLHRLAHQPFDIVVRDVVDFLLVVDGQQRHVGIFAYQYGQRQHAGTAALALALRADGHTNLAPPPPRLSP